MFNKGIEEFPIFTPYQNFQFSLDQKFHLVTAEEISQEKTLEHLQKQLLMSFEKVKNQVKSVMNELRTNSQQSYAKKTVSLQFFYSGE